MWYVSVTSIKLFFVFKFGAILIHGDWETEKGWNGRKESAGEKKIRKELMTESRHVKEKKQKVTKQQQNDL